MLIGLTSSFISRHHQAGPEGFPESPPFCWPFKLTHGTSAPLGLPTRLVCARHGSELTR